MDLGNEVHLRNVVTFEDVVYESFEDVVTFDTTQLTTKYNVPFAPFVGVNHHGQSDDWDVVCYLRDIDILFCYLNPGCVVCQVEPQMP